MYPAVGFYFQVVFQGIDDPNGLDQGFLSVSGLTAGATELDGVALPTDAAGPAGTTHRGGVLLLKRAVRPKTESALTRWLFANLEPNNPGAGNPAPLSCAQIRLLDETHKPYMTWVIHTITPKSWRLGELNGERSEILVEAIELYYERLTWET